MQSYCYLPSLDQTLKIKQIIATRNSSGRIAFLTLTKKKMEIDREWDEKGYLHSLSVSARHGSLLTNQELISLFLQESPLPAANWYDRNAKSITLSFADVIADGTALTPLWTYTVPNDRKTFVEYGEFKILRNTAAGANAIYLLPVYVTPITSKVATEILIAASMLKDVGANDTVIIGQSFLLFPGDVFHAHYSSAAIAGGDVNVIAFAKLTEFDAL